MELLKENYVKYGLAMSAVTAVFILLMHFTGQYTNLDNIGKSPLELIFIIFVPILVWYMGLKAKKKELKGKLTFKEGVRESFKISLIYAVTSPFVYFLYYTFLNSSLLDFMRREYQMPNASDQMIILFDMFVQFVAAIIGGTLYGAIVSVFIRTKKSN